MIAYTTLITAVCGKLRIDYSTADLTKFQVVANLNAAQRHILNTVPSRYISEFVKTVKYNLVSGTNSYQWPSDFIRALRIWVDYTNSISTTNKGREADLIDSVGTQSSKNQKGSKMFPLVGMDVEGGFELDPVPDANVTNGCRLRYIQQLLDISATQNCLLSGQFANLLIYYATYLSAAIEGHDMELSREMKTAFDTELQSFLPKKEN